MRPWHAHREEVFAVMRQIDGAVQIAWVRARELGPRHGYISVGSADFDYTLKATIGEQYLRVLRTGGDPTAAFESAIVAGKESIAKWNSTGCTSRMAATGKFELHRDECAAESIALGFHVRFAAFQEKKPPERVSNRVRFAPAVVDGSGYCGPVCLSALSGLGTKQVTRILRDHFGMKAVRSMTVEQVKWFIGQIGYRIETTEPVRRTLDDVSRSGSGVNLIELHDHVLLQKGRKTICTENNGRIGDVEYSKYRDDSIDAIHSIRGELSETAVGLLLAPRKASVPQNQMALF